MQLNIRYADYYRRQPLHKVLFSLLIIFIITAVFCGCVSAAEFSGGEGTQENPYSISSVDDLKQLAQDVNGGNDYSGKYFNLTKDIDLAGSTWTPIGGKNKRPFSGNFDGCGHTISNLSITKNGMYQGLFGYAKNANFTNVTLTKVSVSGNMEVGALIGSYEVNDNTKTYLIKNCSISGTVISNTMDGGGLVGLNTIQKGNLIIKNCSVSGIVSSSNINVGGLVGHNIVNEGTTHLIENCSVSCTVIGKQSVGCLIGFNNVKGNLLINNCGLLGNVKGGVDGYVGGLIGQNSDKGTIKITNCHVIGDVQSEKDGVGSLDGVGGLIGYNNVHEKADHIIGNCSVSGNISGLQYVGGLIGWNNIAEKDGSTKIENSYTICNISGLQSVGGLIGWNNIAKKDGSTKIENSYTICNISGSGNYIGGIIGNNVLTADSITNIENIYSTGTVSGKDFIGGIIGYNEISVSGKSYINNSASLTHYVNGTSNVSRIIGYSSGTPSLNNNYAWEGMKNNNNFFTDNIGLKQINGENVSSLQVWANKTIYETNLKWKISTDNSKIWKIVLSDDSTSYPLPYLTSLGSKYSYRDDVIYLKPVYVIFNNNSGNGIMPDQGFTPDISQKLTEKPISFTKSGCKFVGWNTQADGLGENYDDKQPISITKNITLYAVWATVTNVTLNFCNDSSTTNNKQVVNITKGEYHFNDTLIKPEYANHRFMGYNNTSSGGGVQVINSTLQLVPDAQGYTSASKWVNESKDIDLWAVWARLYNITVEIPAGGNINADKVNATYGETVTLTGTPDEGYNFGSWIVTNAADDSPVTIIGNTLIMPKSDVNVTAIFNKIPEQSSGTSSHSTAIYLGGVIYTVYFNSTGGSHVDNQTNLYYDDNVIEPDDPTKDGFIFDAWYTKDDYKWDFKNDTVNKSFTLYAKWNSVEVPLTPTKTQTPVPIIGLLIGLCAAALLFRRK